MFAVLRATGLRRGELLILKVDDINFAKNVLRVVRRPDSKQDSRSSLGFVEISRPRRGSGRTQGRLPACRGCNHWSSYCEQQDPPQALVRLSKPELASKAIRSYTEHCERPGSARSGLHGDDLVEPTNALPVDLDCNCTCPGCGAKLLLRQGARWTHFAHYNATPRTTALRVRSTPQRWICATSLGNATQPAESLHLFGSPDHCAGVANPTTNSVSSACIQFIQQNL